MVDTSDVVGHSPSMKGKELRRIRDSLSYTQAQLASALSVAENTVSKWERDERPISAAMEKHIKSTATAEKKKKKGKV
jgi:transcriptional regulator with XRE-family HTH domain